MNLCALVLELHLPQNFCHTHRHFPEIVESCSRHPKMCKSIKNQKSKIFTKPIFSSVYVEESKNKKINIEQTFPFILTINLIGNSRRMQHKCNIRSLYSLTTYLITIFVYFSPWHQFANIQRWKVRNQRWEIHHRKKMIIVYCPITTILIT